MMYHNSIAGALGKLSDEMAVLIMAVGVDTNNVLFWEEIDEAEGLVLDNPYLNLVSSDVGISPLFPKAL